MDPLADKILTVAQKVYRAQDIHLSAKAKNALEQYELAENGRVETRFSFRRGSFDAPVKTYEPTAFIRDETNAHWGMQFVWPVKAEYRIVRGQFGS